jgi:hypothetical protein
MSNNPITADTGGKFTHCPPGNDVASCCQIIVIGTIMESFKGAAPEPTKKVMLGFEITNKKHVFKEGAEPEPFVMHNEYLLSFNEKANLRKLIHSWAGQTFTDAQMKEFNLDDMISCPGLANVVLDTNSKGEQRSKILSITAVPEGLTVPAMINKPLIFNYPPAGTAWDKETKEAFERIPGWIQKKMKTSTEYQAAIASGLISDTGATGQQQQNATPATGTKFPFPKKPV